MNLKIALVSPGAMGASIGALLVRNGAEVFTNLDGRGAASAKRAAEAGMVPVPREEFFTCDAILSIVPPAHAEAVAREFAELYLKSDACPLYLDCNAVNPVTLDRIASTINESGGRFVDASIIGLPAATGKSGPLFLLSGPHARTAAGLETAGLKVRVVEGENGRASAVKMAYAGITKGLTALGATMILGGIRGGVADELRLELQASQPALYDRFASHIPRMFPKAGRWVAEMEEIAGFLGEDTPQGRMFGQIAALYAGLAGETGKDDVAALRAFFEA